MADTLLIARAREGRCYELLVERGWIGRLGKELKESVEAAETDDSLESGVPLHAATGPGLMLLGTKSIQGVGEG